MIDLCFIPLNPKDRGLIWVETGGVEGGCLRSPKMEGAKRELWKSLKER